MPVHPHPDPVIFSPSEGRKEIVLLVSAAACGKSTFSRRFDRDLYTVVNQDTVKTIDKCIKACQAALSEGKLIFHTNYFLSKLIFYSSMGQFYLQRLYLV
jgi:bifunctional polynucleotide phosphatase/kinase